MAAISTFCLAQYGGGGMGAGVGTNTPYNSKRSYGSKAAIIAGVAAGAAVVGGLLYWRHHKRSKLLGCVAADGNQLVSEVDNQTYRLENQRGESLPPGERVELFGKKTKEQTGEPGFEVNTMSKDLGKCNVRTAQAR
ncbi:MAG: hypothetical protein JO356_06075 [Acidobacteria bacterium]|nr:hypothetical protein [Acidobacteriota bacterium]